MKAAAYTRYGPPDVVQIMEVEKPVPKDNEVLIKVHAASVNPVDWRLMEGAPYAPNDSGRVGCSEVIVGLPYNAVGKKGRLPRLINLRKVSKAGPKFLIKNVPHHQALNRKNSFARIS